MIRAEYLWVDGTEPTKTLRSKTKVLDDGTNPDALPEWGFDGSSTNQAKGYSSDLTLVPARTCPDPIRGGTDILVLCEVRNPDGSPHPTNTRAALKDICGRRADAEVWIGIEQEYTMMRRG